MIISPISTGSKTIWIRFTDDDRNNPKFREAIHKMQMELPYPAMITRADGDGFLASDNKHTMRVLEKIKKEYFDEPMQGAMEL